MGIWSEMVTYIAKKNPKFTVIRSNFILLPPNWPLQVHLLYGY